MKLPKPIKKMSETRFHAITSGDNGYCCECRKEIKSLRKIIQLYKNYCREQGYIPSERMMEKIKSVRIGG